MATTTIVGQRWKVYPYADNTGVTPADGEGYVVSGLPGFESSNVMLMGDGVSTVAQLAAKKQYQAIYAYADVDDVVLAGGYQYAVADVPGSTLYVQIVVGDGTHTIAELVESGVGGDRYTRHMKHDLDRLGFTGYDLYTDDYLEDKLRIARRLPVGFNFVGSVSKTPTAFPDAQSSAHTEYPEYFPAICRTDGDHDVSTAQVPQWVIDELNAEKLTFGAVSDFTGTLAAGVITFGAGTEIDHMLDLLVEQAWVARWYASSEAANYGSLGGLFTGSAQFAATIGGVNYAITGASKGARTVTIATYPANGTVTISIHPGRIAGSTTSSRLRRLSGEALVAAGDVTGEVVPGGRRMGKILRHYHVISGGTFYIRATGGSCLGDPNVLQGDSNVEVVRTVSINALEPSSDGTNTLVTGKSNDPRTAGMAVYTHLAVVNATNWT